MQKWLINVFYETQFLKRFPDSIYIYFLKILIDCQGENIRIAIKANIIGFITQKSMLH